MKALTDPITFRLDPVHALGASTNGAASQRRGSIDNVILWGSLTAQDTAAVPGLLVFRL